MKTFLAALLLLMCGSFATAQKSADLLEKSEKAAKNKNYAQAISMIDGAIALDPGNALYYGYKGIYLIHTDSLQAAFNAFSEAIGRDSSIDWLYMNRGNILMSAGMPDEAISDFNTGLKYATKDSDIRPYYLNRGAAKLQKRDFQGALKDIQYAFKLDSSDLGVLINLSAIYDEIGQPEEALACLKRGELAAPDDVAILSNLGFTYQHMGEYKRSIQYFDKCIKQQPKEGVPYSNRSYSKMKMGDLDGALKDINTSIALYPGNSYAYRNLGLIRMEMKQINLACEAFGKALERGYTNMYGKDVEEMMSKNCNAFK